MSADEPTVPYGFCQCGCGRQTQRWTVKESNVNRGRIKGEPKRYIKGHHGRKVVQYIAEDRDYDTPCWIWQLAKGDEGHGRIHLADRRPHGAHVVFYERATGTSAKGLHVHHKCRQPECVNPDHLEALTPAEHRQLHSRLTWEQVRDIRRRIAEGERRNDVARIYGLSPSAVDHISKRRRWREAA